MNDFEEGSVKKKHRLRLKRKIKFDTEAVSKEEAEKLLEQSKKKHPQKPPKKSKIKQSSVENINKESAVKKKKKIKFKEEKSLLIKDDSVTERDKLSECESEPDQKKSDDSESGNLLVNESVDGSANSKVNQTESIRARKRKKHELLLKQKKLKTELNLQQKCLNYLSQWKHSRATWKFEKLKQIWIKQNMFDEAKIPEEFWDTVVDYFNTARGKVKSTVMKDALKIIDDNTEEKDEIDIKYKRARFVIQNLQE